MTSSRVATGQDQARSFRLVFDAARCEGHGMCSLRFPERISLDFWGYAQCDPEPFSASFRHKADAAVRCCPEGALRLVELVASSDVPGASAR